MADEAEAEKTQEQEESKQGDGRASRKKLLPKSLFKWIIMAAVLIACAGAGFGLGRIFAAGRSVEPPAPTDSQPALPAAKATPPENKLDAAQIWYFDLQPVVANLDEPRVTRYVRATLTLAISSDLNQKEGTALLTEKAPLLTNWLTIYLASLSLDDTRGDLNLRRLQAQILDNFNETLFPDNKALIKQILFKEFAVQ